MRNYLKITFLFFVSLCILTQASSQNFGIKAGLNLANMLAKDDQENYSEISKMNIGFHAGAVVEFPISDLLSIEPGVLIASKGLKMVEEDTYQGETYKYTSQMNLYYIDIPINLKIGYDLGTAKIFGLVGPYIGIGLSGKTKSTYESGGESETDTEDIEWGTDPDSHDLKRPDYGVIFGAGALFGAIEVSVSYGLGLANISSYTENGATLQNRVLGISLAYRIGND